MRILIIHNFYRDFNGEDFYFLSLNGLLEEKGNKIIVYTKHNKNIQTDFLSKLKVTSQLFINHQVEKEISGIIKEFKPKIVHIQNVYSLVTPTVYKVCQDFNIPIVQTIHNYRFFCPKSFLFRNGQLCELCAHKKFSYLSVFYGCYNDRLASLAFSSALFFHRIIKTFVHISVFIFPSRFTRDYYVNDLSFTKEKTYVIPCFVDRKIDLTIGKRNIKSDYFLFVGRLSEEKGILPLLDLFKSLPQLKLIVIGDGPLRDRLKKYKRYKNIIFKGFLGKKEVFKHMQDSLAVIIPSLWYEVLPMVLIESFANETPVIVPKFGGFMEAVEDGKNGLFFQYNNFADLKDKIINIYKKRSSLNSMRRNAKKTYETKYTPEIHYKALMKVYNSIIKKL